MNKPLPEENFVVTQFDLLRHGECEGGAIYRGSTDVTLSALGRAQMQSSAQQGYLTGQWDQIISSPLKRCIDFAESLAEELVLPCVAEPAFKELNFGEWEGRELKEVWENDRQNVSQFYQSPSKYPPPSGESLCVLQQRLMEAWGRCLAQYQGQRILLIQHGGTIRVLLATLLGMPLDSITALDIPYAGLSRVNVYQDSQGTRPVLVHLNGVCPALAE